MYEKLSARCEDPCFALLALIASLGFICGRNPFETNEGRIGISSIDDRGNIIVKKHCMLAHN